MTVHGKPRCSVDGCTSLVKARGMCFRHYNAARANGRTCSVNGCQEPPHARQYCSVHYYRWHKHGDPGDAEPLRKPSRSCRVAGCENLAVTREDLCPTHRRRKRLYGNEDGTFATHKKCVQCDAPAMYGTRGSEHCQEHYIAHVKALAVTAVLSGTVTGATHPNGYVYHSVLKRRYAEHHIVMEHLLGRPLRQGEEVHHKNGRRDDNHPRNLELWVKSQPAGQRVKDLIDFVVENYPEYVRAALDGRPHLFL